MIVNIGDFVVLDCKEIGWAHDRCGTVTKIENPERMFVKITDNCPACGMVAGPLKSAHIIQFSAQHLFSAMQNVAPLLTGGIVKIDGGCQLQFYGNVDGKIWMGAVDVRDTEKLSLSRKSFLVDIACDWNRTYLQLVANATP